MSEKHFRIAVRASVDSSADALLLAYGEERAGDPTTLPSLPAAEAFADAQPWDPLVFYEENGWAVLIDLTGARWEREPALAEVSRRLGRLASAAHQDSVGFFQLLVFESGDLRLKAEANGDQPPHAAGLNSAELNRHWQSFGLAPYWQDPPGPVTVTPVRPRPTADTDTPRRRRWFRR